ncbi:LAFE_0B02652g1_1 [Lachancea fermentati]|uniref:LAFE_0B02652g1_1 n=1 Tax=Lachancea fermentati TaxID=4955 RepID=A0A1G4M7L3_LACFM|nr:LAFE_0B02652g1_1 [Lachancea fermentati]
MSKALIRKAKNVVNGYSSMQVLVREATSNDPNGPSLDLMDEISERSYDSVEFFELMDMLDKRLNDKGKNWRHVAKSLTVLDYLVRSGSENCVLWCKENLYVIKTLREFMHEDELGNDQGQIVRVKAKELTSLLLDEERLREEREMRRKKRKSRRRRDPDTFDDDLQRALEESRLTAEQEEQERRMRMGEMADDEDDLQTALQLSKEEEELRRLRELQQQQQLQQAQAQMFPQQQQAMYYDIFGNPISAEEYMQYQQQLAEQQYQQQQYQQLAQQQALAAQQQYLAEQQALAQQQAFAQQQYMQQQFTQQPLATGSNNPFALGSQGKTGNAAPKPAATSPAISAPAPAPAPAVSSPQKPLTQTRTGNQSITDKYSALNTLLATGTGIDTFGNTGDTRVPAQHTKTGNFINSQGTGYRQVGDQPKHNPFLGTQYTGLPSSSIVPSYTGYGFGNQGGQTQQSNNQQNNADQGFSLIDL